jgi:metal-dependent amidase/aminoacylase/carboxypeptidase family protein
MNSSEIRIFSREIMEMLDSRVDKIAQEIASWESTRQENLLRKLVDLNYRRGLKKLSQKIRKRLKAEGKLDQSVDEIFSEMARIREDVAANDYRR